jgi:secreted trypsin-like serine protease
MSQVTGDFKKPKYLYGIVSFGTRRCGTVQKDQCQLQKLKTSTKTLKFVSLQGIPGVYTNVAFYMDWIISHLRP